MSDMGETFQALREHNLERRNKIEPERMKYAAKEISKAWTHYHLNGDRIVIRLPSGTITFWPYTGWFQGQKPYGKIKGRGINNLIKEIIKCPKN